LRFYGVWTSLFREVLTSSRTPPFPFRTLFSLLSLAVLFFFSPHLSFIKTGNLSPFSLPQLSPVIRGTLWSLDLSAARPAGYAQAAPPPPPPPFNNCFFLAFLPSFLRQLRAGTAPVGVPPFFPPQLLDFQFPRWSRPVLVSSVRSPTSLLVLLLTP